MRADDTKNEKGLKATDGTPLNKKIFSMQIDKKEIHSSILEYFSEYGYCRAFYKFSQEVEQAMEPAPLLNEREKIRNLASNGKFLEIIKTLEEAIPCIFVDRPELLFSILEQDVLEDLCIRMEPEGATLSRIKKDLSPIVLQNAFLVKHLEDLVSSIVFAQFSFESVMESRASVFKKINKTVLLHLDYIMKDSIKLLLDDIKSITTYPEILPIIKGCPTFEKVVGTLYDK